MLQAQTRASAATEASVPSLHRLVRAAAVVGMVAPLLCGVVFVVAARLRPGYSSVQQYGSALAVGPHAWLQTLNFLQFGAGTMVLALGLGVGLRGGWQRWSGPLLIGVFGLGWVLVALFNETHTTVHDRATELYLALPVACFVLVPLLRRDPHWRGLVRVTVASGVVSLVLAAGWYEGHVQALIPDFSAWAGLYQRVFYGVMLTWLEVVAIQLYRLSQRRRTTEGR